MFLSANVKAWLLLSVPRSSSGGSWWLHFKRSSKCNSMFRSAFPSPAKQVMNSTPGQKSPCSQIGRCCRWGAHYQGLWETVKCERNNVYKQNLRWSLSYTNPKQEHYFLTKKVYSCVQTAPRREIKQQFLEYPALF